MDDLISRVAAINAFMNATADGDKVDFCIGVVRAVPSVQRLDEDGTFWINIDNFDDDFDKINRVVFDDGFWCETFYQDAQPVDKDINVPTNDIISRKAAIDAICKHYTDLERRGITCLAITNHKQVSVDLLESLPSAQPEPIWGLPVSADRPLADEEIVSRLRTIQRQVGGSYAIDRAIEVIEAVASAQLERKRGKWIYGEDEYGIDGYRCDKCGFFVPWDYAHTFINYIEDYNFCPNCGADMRGEQDG